MKRKRILKATIFCLLAITCSCFLALSLIAFFLQHNKGSENDTQPAILPIQAEVVPAEPVVFGPEAPYTPTEVYEYPITLMAVGDNLMHMGVVHTGHQEDGSYDYSCLYESISEFLDYSDIRIINQETILGGNQLGFSGYPLFNSPTEVADSLSAAGFNVVLQSSNHTYDQGIDGIKNCISVWEDHPEVLMVGIHDKTTAESSTASNQTPEDAGKASRDIPTLTIEDMKFAILNYTYGPNLGAMPSSLQGYMDVLCDYNPASGVMDFTSINPAVLEDIARAKKVADVVIVCPHWGTEYSTSASTYQKKFALQMTEAGADIIIGTHPHVVEPIEWIKASNGNEALCYYSLGNYVSTQKDPISMLEGLAWIQFIVTIDGENKTIALDKNNSGVIPIVCHYNASPVRIEGVYPLENYTEEDAARHGIRSYGHGILHLSELKKWSEEIFGDFVLPIPF